MDILLESPIVMAAIGAVPLMLAATWFVQTRTTPALLATAGAVLLLAALVVTERAIQTPREQVQSAVDDLFSAIRTNDLPGVLRLIDAAATEMRSDAEVLMPMFRVESAGEGGEVRVEVAADGATATADFKPIIKVQHTKSGATGAYFDKLRLDYVRRDGEWLLSGYEPAKDWRDGAARLGR